MPNSPFDFFPQHRQALPVIKPMYSTPDLNQSLAGLMRSQAALMRAVAPRGGGRGGGRAAGSHEGNPRYGSYMDLPKGDGTTERVWVEAYGVKAQKEARDKALKTRQEQILAKETNLQSELAKLPTLSVEGQKSTIDKIRKEIMPGLTQKTGMTAEELSERILKNPEAELHKREQAIKNTGWLDILGSHLKDVGRSFYNTVAALGDSSAEKITRGRAAAEERQKNIESNPYREELQRREREGLSNVGERFSAKGLTDLVGGTVGYLAPPIIGGALLSPAGAIVAGVLGGAGMAGGEALERVATDPRIKTEAEREAAVDKAYGLNMLVGGGLAAIPGPIGATRALLAGAPLKQVLTGGIATAPKRYLTVGQHMADSALLGGAFQAGTNAAYGAATGVAQPVTEGLAEAVAGGALFGLPFGIKHATFNRQYVSPRAKTAQSVELPVPEPLALPRGMEGETVGGPYGPPPKARPSTENPPLEYPPVPVGLRNTLIPTGESTFVGPRETTLRVNRPMEYGTGAIITPPPDMGRFAGLLSPAEYHNFTALPEHTSQRRAVPQDYTRNFRLIPSYNEIPTGTPIPMTAQQTQVAATAPVQQQAKVNAPAKTQPEFDYNNATPALRLQYDYKQAVAGKKTVENARYAALDALRNTEIPPNEIVGETLTLLPRNRKRGGVNWKSVEAKGFMQVVPERIKELQTAGRLDDIQPFMTDYYPLAIKSTLRDGNIKLAQKLIREQLTLGGKNIVENYPRQFLLPKSDSNYKLIQKELNEYRATTPESSGGESTSTLGRTGSAGKGKLVAENLSPDSAGAIAASATPEPPANANVTAPVISGKQVEKRGNAGAETSSAGEAEKTPPVAPEQKPGGADTPDGKSSPEPTAPVSTKSDTGDGGDQLTGGPGKSGIGDEAKISAEIEAIKNPELAAAAKEGAAKLKAKKVEAEQNGLVTDVTTEVTKKDFQTAHKDMRNIFRDTLPLLNGGKELGKQLTMKQLLKDPAEGVKNIEKAQALLDGTDYYTGAEREALDTMKSYLASITPGEPVTVAASNLVSVPDATISKINSLVQDKIQTDTKLFDKTFANYERELPDGSIVDILSPGEPERLFREASIRAQYGEKLPKDVKAIYNWFKKEGVEDVIINREAAAKQAEVLRARGDKNLKDVDVLLKTPEEAQRENNAKPVQESCNG